MFKSKAIFAGVMSMALLACTACGKVQLPRIREVQRDR